MHTAANAGLSPVHGLFGCAGEDGVLECFDLRMKNAAGSLDAATNCGAPGMCAAECKPALVRL